MAVSRNYSSVAQPTTLTGNINAGSTTVGVASPTGYPATPFTAAIDYGTATEELVEVIAASLGTWTVTRGIDGTSAQSHSIGAVVRHVTSARDSADSRSHEAATSAVHGVAGTLVGTSDTQTLANKTLTSPTINSAAVSGTFTGTPVFSGAVTFNSTVTLTAGGSLAGAFSGSPTLSGTVTFTGEPVFSGGVLLRRSNAGDLAQRALVSGDTQDRHQVQADGRHLWGTGAATPDVNLYRGSAGTLKTDSALTVAPSGANGGLVTNVTNGAFTGKLADFQRAGVSKASFDQDGNLTAANMTLGAWSSWTPAWSTTTGAHIPSYGNAVVAGGYAKFGRTVHFTLGITFGNTTTFGAGAGTGDDWTFSLPGGLTPSSNFDSFSLTCGSGRLALGSTAAVPVVVRVYSGIPVLVLYISGGRADGTAITNGGLVDAVSPWTWVSGGAIQISGTFEATA